MVEAVSVGVTVLTSCLVANFGFGHLNSLNDQETMHNRTPEVSAIFSVHGILDTVRGITVP